MMITFLVRWDIITVCVSQSSSSEEEEGAEADDEFECDCPLCRYNRGGNRGNNNRGVSIMFRGSKEKNRARYKCD